MTKSLSANEIRKSFIDFFTEKKGHRFVPSSSLVPGGDATLLFTNAGMVQFKDIFLGTDKRDYQRVVNSQKCMRVAGKHNDLEDVGFNDSHHTFFEMLGNWSFGDYYKEEAITWAWELFTEVWGLSKESLYFTVFKDEQGEIPTDDEAVTAWKKQPGLIHEHIIYLGRSDNFWEMAETGPCGPNSEIHIDMGEEYGEITYRDDGQVDLDGSRFLELWNLVFIQFNRTGPKSLVPLPSMHVDTGLGLDRIVAVLQGKDSNYRTDLFSPIIDKIQSISGHSDQQVEDNFTPYRVIADHCRAATFLIADGVVPGNMSRNYVTRMVIRRAARFGSKIGLDDPFLAQIAEVVIESYGEAYPELFDNKETILNNLTREEERFQQTLASGMSTLDTLLDELVAANESVLSGDKAFELYATHGLPFEISRDIAKERGLDVEEESFQSAFDEHRKKSGGGQAIGDQGGEDAELFQEILQQLITTGKLGADGVDYDPYTTLRSEGEVLALVKDGKSATDCELGDQVEVVLPRSGFYVASGGQVSDSGMIVSANNSDWEIEVFESRFAAAGMLTHIGKVSKGNPKVGDLSIAQVDTSRRQNIMRNHTATHLLHAALHKTLGKHARQAGSLVAPDRLRFDFTHNDAINSADIDKIEAGVNEHILDNFALNISHKSLDEAKKEGAMALFGEKYADVVRTVKIGNDKSFSYELCGGTHVAATSEIGNFLILSEGSAAAGIRRIEAVTGQAALHIIRERLSAINHISQLLKVTPDEAVKKVAATLTEYSQVQKELEKSKFKDYAATFESQLDAVEEVGGVPVLTTELAGAKIEVLRQMADRFRKKFTSGVAVLAGGGKTSPLILAIVSEDLVERGLHAGELVKHVAAPLGGSGGGRATMAQAGGKDGSKIKSALDSVPKWIEDNIKSK